eukprot:CAMPEP_0198294530 /NCGR_PEP_ID=MMETSP1449-20131203/22851_1 /TAXON_ID=420275 /ORGANISM="Attheya septentrionalis, Strain CCMP2084" /LENGTH=427 /DNA_ID=CAMNT_0043994507 /DNA_START=121 /DNA_END=1401 /DNA_ORIENTATION=-
MTRARVFRVLPFLFLLALVPSRKGCAQETERWKEWHRLDYNYDLNSPLGPANWGNVDVGDSEWGEFGEYVDHAIHDIEFSGNQCEEGRQPSPLNLFTNEPCLDTHEILTRMQRDTDCNENDLTFEILPNALRAYMPETDDTCERPEIDMPNGFPDRFTFAWMELHMPAEHVLDGRRYDAELQMVHLGTESDDHLAAMVSVLFDASARRDNPQWQWMLDRWQEVRNEMDQNDCTDSRRTRHRRTPELKMKKKRTSTTPLTKAEKDKLYYGTATPSRDEHGNAIQTEEDRAVLLANFTSQNGVEDAARRLNGGCNADRFGRGCEPLEPRNKMFPYNMWPTIFYYRYRGAITYPPCTSNVQWRVLDEPMQISRRQYKQMAALLNSHKDESCEPDVDMDPRGSNAAPLKTPNPDPDTQSIVHCTFDHFSFW